MDLSITISTPQPSSTFYGTATTNHFPRYSRSEALEAVIREIAEKLDQFYEKIMARRVMVEAPHGHHHKGYLYHIRIGLTVPRADLIIKCDPRDLHANEDPYVALRGAFKAARRKL